MKNFISSLVTAFVVAFFFAFIAVVFGAAAAPLPSRADEFSVHESHTQQRRFALANPNAPANLDIDNVIGSITVIADSPGAIQATAREEIDAESQQKLTEARRAVTLQISSGGNGARFYVNGPFRCRRDCNGDDIRGYRVRYNFEVHVPSATDLVLKTVNEGDIRVRGVSGTFNLRNVNGGIELDSIGGEGEATTVNGPVKASFHSQPSGPCIFKTINGGIALYFPSNLSADFRFSTLNGSIYSDFSTMGLPSAEAIVERHGDMKVIRTPRSSRVRIGAGGSEIRADDLNGDIRILHNSNPR
jgi:hypothetical protein